MSRYRSAGVRPQQSSSIRNMYMSIILEQQEAINKLAALNKHLTNLLAQYMEVEAEEQKLIDILKENTKEGHNNGLDT